MYTFCVAIWETIFATLKCNQHGQRECMWKILSICLNYKLAWWANINRFTSLLIYLLIASTSVFFCLACVPEIIRNSMNHQESNDWQKLRFSFATVKFTLSCIGQQLFWIRALELEMLLEKRLKHTWINKEKALKRCPKDTCLNRRISNQLEASRRRRWQRRRHYTYITSLLN